MKLVYLAAPYRDTGGNNPDVEESRRQAATLFARVAMMEREGVAIYSPLTHSVPIEKEGFEFSGIDWYEHGLELLSRCDEVWVLPLDGWEESKGVALEIERAKQFGIPAFKVALRTSNFQIEEL